MDNYDSNEMQKRKLSSHITVFVYANPE